MDWALAYYMFVNHGTQPGEIAALSEREKIVMWAMAQKEMKGRSK